MCGSNTPLGQTDLMIHSHQWEVALSCTHTPAHSQDRDLAVVAASLLRFPGRGLHQRPFLLAAAVADVLVSAQAADGVQVAAGVFRGSRGSTW